jgi:flavin prenyltransferase
MSGLPVVLAITGASGAPYGLRLLQVVAESGTPVWLIVTAHGWRLLREECGIGGEPALAAAVGKAWRSVTVFTDDDRGARPASGSARSAGMVICPCSMATLAGVATGNSRSLVERAADVALKERRRLILVPRETPVSLVHLRNMVAVTEAGATVIPAAPGFYQRPRTIADLVDFVVQRIVDHLGLEVELVPRWSGKPAGRAARRR